MEPFMHRNGNLVVVITPKDWAIKIEANDLISGNEIVVYIPKPFKTDEQQRS